LFVPEGYVRTIGQVTRIRFIVVIAVSVSAFAAGPEDLFFVLNARSPAIFHLFPVAGRGLGLLALPVSTIAITDRFRLRVDY
jgi:hypothetical protein